MLEWNTAVLLLLNINELIKQVYEDTAYLCGFFLKELHLSILKKCKESRDDVFQEGGVLRRRCNILKLIFF